MSVPRAEEVFELNSVSLVSVGAGQLGRGGDRKTNDV